MQVFVPVPIQWHAQQRTRGRRMNLCNQSQRFAIGADEQVQTIVERDAVDFHAPRAATEYCARFIDGDGYGLFRQRDRGSHTGIAATDDSDVQRRVRHV